MKPEKTYDCLLRECDDVAAQTWVLLARGANPERLLSIFYLVIPFRSVPFPMLLFLVINRLSPSPLKPSNLCQEGMFYRKLNNGSTSVIHTGWFTDLGK